MQISDSTVVQATHVEMVVGCYAYIIILQYNGHVCTTSRSYPVDKLVIHCAPFLKNTDVTC